MGDSARPYIHGTDSAEQQRLALLNRLSNPPFLDFLGDVDGLRILDVGSGLGTLASDVARRNPNGFTVGVEYSADQLHAANQPTSGNLAFSRADAHALPFADGSFDLVYCRYLLEHVQNPLQVLQELRRVLKPGGRAAAQENNILINQFYPDCPAFDSVWARFVELQSRLGGDALIGKKLFALFRQAGFRDIELTIQPEVHWQGSPGFRPWVENLIGNLRSAQSELLHQSLSSDREITTAIAELESLMECDDSSAYFYWNRAVGFH